MDWKERLKAEQNELDERIIKLLAFFESDACIELDDANKALLQIQYRAMLTYQQVLIQRMDLNNVE